MFHTLTKDEFLELAKNNKYVSIYRELLADAISPISALETLANKNDHAMLLESGARYRETGAYSFVSLQPYANFSTRQGITTISINQTSETFSQEPLSLLRTFHQKFHCAIDTHTQATDSGLIGQMMGYFSYDAIRYFEAIPDSHQDNDGNPEILFNFYRINLIFNHEKNKLLLAIILEVTQDAAELYDQVQKELDEIVLKLQNAVTVIPKITVNPAIDDAFETDCSDELFAQKVQQAKTYIQAGDVFQIVLSRTFYKKISADPLAIYRVLRNSNPTPYMFYFYTPDLLVFGASPEKLVSVEDRQVTIAPIAGTIAIGNESVDEALLEKFRNDPKERAEHMMLVDLARNDIGAVCEPGTVKVTELMRAQKLTHVVHLVSYVKGTLAANYDAFDVLKHSFPAGTLSGAPKIRAMQLIDEIEYSKRHLYGGAICKVDSAGNLDSCIIIRSAVVKNGLLQVRAGAGIVFDSNPAAEAAETRQKAKGLLKAVNMVAETGN